MATNRQAAEDSAKAVATAGLAEPDEAVAVTYSALAGIIMGLLDVADAIREQTKATAPRPGADLPADPADIAKDYHTEAIESGVGVLEDINATLESVRTEIADLRATVDKAARR